MIEDPFLTTKAFYLYICLKIHGKYADTLRIHNVEIKEFTKWDNRTIKKYLKELKEKKYINYTLPLDEKGNEIIVISNPINIYIYPLEDKIEFSYVDEDILRMINNSTDKICVDKMRTSENGKEIAVRLYYLYEKYYNKKFNTPAILSYQQIKNIVGGNFNKIIAINKILSDNGLLEIIRRANKNIHVANHYYPIWRDYLKSEKEKSDSS